MKYALVKCSTNEIFIGSVVSSTELSIILSNPLKITMLKASIKDRVSCCISEWNEIADEDYVELNKSHVLYITNPRKDVVDYYLQSLIYFSNDVENHQSTSSKETQRILH